MPIKKQLNIHVEVDVLTAGTTAEIVNAILETLLYQRNQIPFVYKTYRYYVDKWREEEHNNSNLIGEDCGVQSFQVQRKKQQATSTKEAISSMRQTIINIFAKKRIKSLRFLFGSTIFTAKEAYTVHIPSENIALNHFHEHHKLLPGNLNQTLLSLLTSEDLYAVFSHNLNPTNIYLELELLDIENLELTSLKDSLYNSKIFPKDFLPLPARCKDIHIYLLHTQNPTTNPKHLKCCNELKVFEDFISLNLKCCSEQEKQNANDKKDKTLTTITTGWWEADIVVRGFKDHLIKGFNLWS